MPLFLLNYKSSPQWVDETGAPIDWARVRSKGYTPPFEPAVQAVGVEEEGAEDDPTALINEHSVELEAFDPKIKAAGTPRAGGAVRRI